MNPDKRKLLPDNGTAASSKYNEEDDEDDNNEDADEDDLSSNHVDVSDYINMMCSNFAVVESFDSKDSSFSQDSGEDSREFVVGFYDDGGKEKFEMLLLRKKDLTTDDCRCPNGHAVRGSGNNEDGAGHKETFPRRSCALEEYNELVQQNNSKCFDEEVPCESEDESHTVTGNDVETEQKDISTKWRPDEYNSLIFAHNTEQFDEAEQVITSDGEVVDETVHDGNCKCSRHDKEASEFDSGLQTIHDSRLEEKMSSSCEVNPEKASYPSGDFGAIYVPVSKISVEDRSLDHLRDKPDRQSGSRLIKSKSAKNPSAVPQSSEISDRVTAETVFEDNRFDCWKPRQFGSTSDYSDESKNASTKKSEETGDYISSYSSIERNPLYFQAMSAPNSVKRIFPCYNLMPCDNDVDIEPPLLCQSHSGLRHRRKRKDVEVTISNEVPDYMGDRDVEEVLLFIYGKETQNAVSSKTDPKSCSLAGKTDKKKKKKKHHQSKHNKNQAEKPDQPGKNPDCDKDGRQLSDCVNINDNKQEREDCIHVVPDQMCSFSGDSNEMKHCKGGKSCKAEAKGCSGSSSSRAKKKKAIGRIDAGSVGHLPQQPTASRAPFPDCDDDFLLRLSYLSEDEKVKTVEQNFTLVANKKSKKMSAKPSDKADDFAVTLSNKPSSTRSSSHLPNIQRSYASFKSCSSNDSVNESTCLNLSSNDEKDCRGSQPALGNDLQSTSALRVSSGHDATNATSKHDNGHAKKKTKVPRTDVQKSNSGTKKQTKQLDGNRQSMKISKEVHSCPAALDYAALDDIVLSSVIYEANDNEAEKRRSSQISGSSETSSTNSNISLQQRDRSWSPSEMPVNGIFVDSTQNQLGAISCVCFNESRCCSDQGNSAELDQNFCKAFQDASLSDSSRSLHDSSVKFDALVAPPDKPNAPSSFKSENRAASLNSCVSKSLQLPSKESVAFSEFQVDPENVLPSKGTETSSGVDLSIASSNATMTQDVETPGVASYPTTIVNGDFDDVISSASSPVTGQKKPVVFLDTKQVNARSHDMGITFGFDANTGGGDVHGTKSESLSDTSLQSCSLTQSHSDCVPCDCVDEETSEKTDADFFLGMSGLHQNGYRVPHLCKPTYLVYPNGHLFSGAPLTYIPYVPFIPPGLGFSPHMGPPVGVVPPMMIRSTEDDDDDGDDAIGYKVNSHDGCGPNPDLTLVELASSMPIRLPPEAASVRGKPDGNSQRFNLSQAVRYVHREYEKVLKKVTQSSNCPVVWYSSDHDN